ECLNHLHHGLPHIRRLSSLGFIASRVAARSSPTSSCCLPSPLTFAAASVVGIWLSDFPAVSPLAVSILFPVRTLPPSPFYVRFPLSSFSSAHTWSTSIAF
ncbi:hypothetical protein L9F63_005151, partial [Diploptera punctata]